METLLNWSYNKHFLFTYSFITPLFKYEERREEDFKTMALRGRRGEERKGVKMGKSSIEGVMEIMLLHVYTIDK